MKKLILTAAVIMMMQFVNAQNTFPTTGNVGIGTLTPMLNMTNEGLQISKGGHSTIVLGNPFSDGVGGFIQTSDDKHRVFIGANLYDDINYSWKKVNPSKGAAGISILADEGGWGTGIAFYLTQQGILEERMTLKGNGNIGIGTTNPETLLNVNVGSGGSNGIAGIRVGGLNNYSSLEFGIDGDYDGMIRSYGNNINYYAGHWKTKGNVASENHSHNWYTSKIGSSDWSSVKMTLNENGNLGIGIASPTNKLDVNGTIHSKEVKVDMNGWPWPDYVFKKEYSLPTLEEVEKQISEKGYLANIPSEEEVLKNGINLGEMNAKLLQKIEELTLYAIKQEKKNNEQAESIKNLDKQIELLKRENETFKTIFERLSQIEQKLK